MEKNNTQTKISFSQYLRRLFIAPIVLMFVLAIEAITLSFLYIKTNSSLYLIISISLTGALLAAIVIYLIFLVKSIHRTFYVDLYTKSLVNYQALVNQNREIQKFTTSSSFYEFDALNDLLDQIINEYENATITNKMASIRDIGFEYVGHFKDVITYPSFSKLYPQLIYRAQYFRNAFISITYDLDKDLITDEEKIDIFKQLRLILNYSDIVIADNSLKNEFIVFVPNFDSFSKLKEDIDNVIKNITVVRKTATGSRLVIAHASVVIYPYSEIEDIIADLRYANRQGKVVNFYLPNKQTRNEDKILQLSSNINNVSRAYERLSSINVDITSVDKIKEYVNKVITDLCLYFQFDRAGLFAIDDITGNFVSVLSYQHGVNVKPEGDVLEKEYIECLAEIEDDDHSYFFSSRNHCNAHLGLYLDKYGIEAGHFYVVRSENKVAGIIYFLSSKEIHIDHYLRESLIIISHYLANIYKEIVCKNQAVINSKRFDDVLKISGSHLYSIDKETHILRAVSSSLKDICQTAEVGQPCYKAIYGKDKPCDKCPLITGKKMYGLINVEDKQLRFESTLALNGTRGKESIILLNPEDDNYIKRDRFDKDLLINSFYSFVNNLQNSFTLNGKGYCLVLNFDNYNDLLTKYTDEQFNAYIRELINDIKAIGNNYQIYAYSSSDALIVMLPEVGRNEVIEFVEKIYNLSKKDYLQDGNNTQLLISYYGLTYPLGLPNAIDYIRNLDREISSYRGDKGKDMLYFPDIKYSRCASHKDYVLSVLNESFTENTFTIKLQPFVRKVDRHIIGAELLLRINDEYRKMEINTAELIQVAAENGKISLITDSLLNLIGKLYQENGNKLFKKYGLDKLSCNTNFSYFENNKEFFDKVNSLLETYQMPADLLTFEIAESEISAHYEEFKEITRKILRSGITLLCDNYTGAYLSAEKIKDLGFKGIKIDRKIVSKISEDPIAYNATKSIIDVAEENGLSVTLVGVETKAQYSMLKDIRKTFEYQGYYFFKPLSADELLYTLQKDIR